MDVALSLLWAMLATLMRSSIAIVVLMPVLAGCSSGWLFETPAQGRPADTVETIQQFYRPLATQSVRGMAQAPNAPVEISDLKISVAPQPGDWTACVRTWKDGAVQYYSVFFRDRAIIDTRRSLVIDRCEQEQYWLIPG